MAKNPTTLKSVETLMHNETKRKYIPTAEHQSVLTQDDATPRTVKYLLITGVEPASEFLDDLRDSSTGGCS